MSRIRLLPETVASQVAAGEVVERPGSVVKELVENSIDAGARKIDVMIRRGGVSMVRVIDDGVGMDRDDALLSLERHATSKIRSASDLHAIATLGFRGEALPSIASVARFRLTDREPGAVAGTEIIVNGGKIDVVRDGGEAPGTQVEVRSLFYNLPARRKFLRSENTETRNIEHQVHLQAIGHSRIAFTFVRDDRLVFQLPSTENLLDRLRDLYGTESVSRLLEIKSADSSEVRLSGFIGQAGVSRQTRDQQLTFVNGRTVENPLLSGALREGYHTALMKGQYPVTFLFLEIDPASVDVNVHPAKREVRFRDPAAVRETVIQSIQQTLESERASWQDQFRAPVAGVADPGRDVAGAVADPGRQLAQPPNAPSLQPSITPIPGDRDLPHLKPDFALRGQRSVEFVPPPVAGVVDPGREKRIPAQPEPAPRRTPQNFQIIGVLNKLYVLMENADDRVLVDRHRAHARIPF